MLPKPHHNMSHEEWLVAEQEKIRQSNRYALAVAPVILALLVYLVPWGSLLPEPAQPVTWDQLTEKEQLTYLLNDLADREEAKRAEYAEVNAALQRALGR